MDLDVQAPNRPKELQRKFKHLHITGNLGLAVVPRTASWAFRIPRFAPAALPHRSSGPSAFQGLPLALAGLLHGLFGAPWREPGPNGGIQMIITRPSEGLRSSSRVCPIQVDRPGARGTVPEAVAPL